MIDRFRAFLDRPLDPSAGRAILVLAAAIFLGFAAIVVVAGGEHGPADRSGAAMPAQATTPSAPPPPEPDVDRLERRGAPAPSARIRRQDPQDRRGSAAARRTASALRAHRALQHVPYRRGELAIDLVGADRGRAVLRVSAPSRAAGRRGWSEFLRRFHDRGGSYVMRLVASGEGDRRG
jgi:hypothetical protein